MADLLTRGCIDKIVRGECPESFTVQVESCLINKQNNNNHILTASFLETIEAI